MKRSFLSLCLVAVMAIAAHAEDKKPGTATFVVSGTEGCALSLEVPGSDSLDQPAALPTFEGLALGENDEVTVTLQKGVLAAKKTGSMTMVVEDVQDGLLYLVTPDWDGLSMPSTLPAFEGISLAKNDPVVVTVALKKKGAAGKTAAHTGGPDCKCRQCQRIANIAARDEAKLKEILTVAQSLKKREDLKKLTPVLLDFFGDDKAAAEKFMRKVDKELVDPANLKNFTLEDILQFAK